MQLAVMVQRDTRKGVDQLGTKVNNLFSLLNYGRMQTRHFTIPKEFVTRESETNQQTSNLS